MILGGRGGGGYSAGYLTLLPSPNTEMRIAYPVKYFTPCETVQLNSIIMCDNLGEGGKHPHPPHDETLTMYIIELIKNIILVPCIVHIIIMVEHAA